MLLSELQTARTDQTQKLAESHERPSRAFLSLHLPETFFDTTGGKLEGNIGTHRSAKPLKGPPLNWNGPFLGH